MRKIKPYNFKGVDCYDLNSLAEEYIKNFFDGINDIYSNSKNLINFVKRCRNDKSFTKEIVEILCKSKYKNNALTFIIFAFTGYGRIVINGVEMNFEQFIELFKRNKCKENNVLYSFLEDGGIFKTFALVLHDEKLSSEAKSIEANYDLDFTRLYLEGYYSYKETQSFLNRISNIILSKEELFKKATDLCESNDFQISIAHKVGFNQAIAIHKEKNPLFESIKLLKQTNEFQDEDLLKLITDTFYWWLLDNLDRYVAKSKNSKRLFERIKDIQKKYKKYEDLIKKKKIYDLAVDSMTDLSKEMYNCYMEFVILYRNDQIIVKKKYSGYDYVFDKPYCNTFITQSYMNGRVITIDKLNGENSDDVIEPNGDSDSPSSEEIKESKKTKKEKVKKEKKNKKQAIEEAKTVVASSKEESASDGLDIEMLRKKNNKNGRGKSFLTFEFIVIILAILALYLFEYIKKTDIGISTTIKKMPIFYGMIGAIGALIIMLPIFSSKLKKAYKASINLEFIQNTKKTQSLTLEQEKRLNELKKVEDKNIKQITNTHYLLSSLILVAFSVLVSCFVAIGYVTVDSLGKLGPLAELELTLKMTDSNLLIGLSVSSIVALIYGFAKKYKGVLSILLITLLAAMSLLVVLYFMK